MWIESQLNKYVFFLNLKFVYENLWPVYFISNSLRVKMFNAKKNEYIDEKYMNINDIDWYNNGLIIC